MASNLSLRSFSVHLSVFLLLSILSSVKISAQSPPNNNNNNNNSNLFQTAKFNPSMAVIIVVLVSAFFFLGFFSIYIRQCGGARVDSFAATAAAALGARSRRQRGLDPSILDTFPKLIYSDVKDHKIGKAALECAICLNEFEDHDTIRLLPNCDHAFHQECIDAWLENHVTCPVCRMNYTVNLDSPPESAPIEVTVQTVDPVVPAAPDQVVIEVDEGERRQEMKELARIASRLRRNGSRRPRGFSRSHSTGHSMMLQSEGLDRYTLRLPENVRRDIMLQRQGSSRVSRVIGEDSRGRGRSVRMGRSDRWPTFFARSLSAKIPAWGNWRRGEDGSVKEGSTKGKFAGKTRPDDSESSTAALNPV